MEEYKLVIGLGALAAYVIKFLQGSKYFPWISAEAHKITLAVQALLSLGTSLGISSSWDPAAHSLLISGLSLATIFHGLIGWLSQFAIQHGFTNLITLGQANGFSMALPARSGLGQGGGGAPAQATPPATTNTIASPPGGKS